MFTDSFQLLERGVNLYTTELVDSLLWAVFKSRLHIFLKRDGLAQPQVTGINAEVTGRNSTGFDAEDQSTMIIMASSNKHLSSWKLLEEWRKDFSGRENLLLELEFGHAPMKWVKFTADTKL